MAELKHIRGAKYNECPACCCRGGYIHKECGGKWHERVVDDDPEDGWIHNYKCDKCNETDYAFDYADLPIEFEGDNDQP